MNDNEPAINIIHNTNEHGGFQIWVDTEEGQLLQGTILGVGKSLDDAKQDAYRTLRRLEDGLNKANIYVEDEFGELHDDEPISQGDEKS